MSDEPIQQNIIDLNGATTSGSGAVFGPSASRNLEGVQTARELYWQNVVREMLTGLSMLQNERKELFDGRIAVLTHGGERIPIAEVYPMFACGVNGTAADRAASLAVECTVFRIRTPSGEVFTFPLHEIRSMHSLTPELVKQLEQESLERMSGPDSETKPFGFAAFTSPAKTTE